MQKDYQICTRCVMDTTDPDITFDKNGVCHHCHDYDLYIKYYTYPAEEGQKILKQIVQKIKNDGKGKDYDCLIGISGGVDSSFVSHKVVELGLRPLAVHLDNGWDSELAVSNIHKILNKLNIDLYTYVIDWEEFKDLQLAFLKASTPDSEIPSDHAIAAIMYQTADQMGIKYVIPGQNFRTESHAVPAWSRGHYDWKYIENVHKRYGKIPLKTYPHFTVEDLRKYQSKQLWVYLLDYINYNKQEAMNFLKEHYDWQYYGGKHYESVYTRFFQGYILPVKFGFDKRRMHLSSLICSGEISRSDALKELEKPTYSPAQQEEDRDYVIKKLGLSDDEFDAIMQMPKKTIFDYPSYANDAQHSTLGRIVNHLRTHYPYRKFYKILGALYLKSVQKIKLL